MGVKSSRAPASLDRFDLLSGIANEDGAVGHFTAKTGGGYNL